MATMFGKLEEYDMATGKDWIQYIERMEYYFQANKITEGDTKKAILISVMGEKAYKLMRSLVSPAKPNDKSFGHLVKAMRGHLCVLCPQRLYSAINLILEYGKMGNQ